MQCCHVYFTRMQEILDLSEYFADPLIIPKELGTVAPVLKRVSASVL